MSETRTRAWMITAPAEGEKGVSRQDLEQALEPYSAYRGQLEVGVGGYRHWQLLLSHSEPIRFSTLHRKLPTAHLEPARSVAASLDYVSKSDTRVEGVEPLPKGEIEVKKVGQRSDLEALRQRVLDTDATVEELLLDEPSAWRYSRMLSDLVAARDRDRYGKQRRDVHVRVIVGATGTGKTTAALDGLGRLGDVCRLTEWGTSGLWDGYSGQPSVLMEEFRGQVPISQLLTWLDVHPVTLPARYYARTAQFTNVVIVSNAGIETWYPDEPLEVRAALARRIDMYEIWHSDEKKGLIELVTPAEVVRLLTTEKHTPPLGFPAVVS